MAKPRMDLTSFVDKLLEQDDVDALREGVRILAQAIMETEVSSQIGALPYERSSDRSAYRNGYRTRTWDTRVGTIELKIPKVTRGTYFPSLVSANQKRDSPLRGAPQRHRRHHPGREARYPTHEWRDDRLAPTGRPRRRDRLTSRRRRGSEARSPGRSGDVVGGISAAFVLIPQALAYATVAGMPPETGLYVAALAPIAAAFFASSPYLGTGPTAVTSLLTFGGLSALAAPGSPDYVALAALLAVMVGAIRIVMGLLRGGVIAYLLSRPVLQGFTSAAGVVILASQIPTVVGVGTSEENPFLSALDALEKTGAWDPGSIAVAAVAAFVIVGGRRIHPLFPGVLVAMGAAIGFSVWTGFDGPTVGDVEAGMPPLSLALPWGSGLELLIPAAVIATVGFSEPAAIARHYATLDRQRWNPNRELISQGMANLVAGIGGGFPAGGSFSRSSLVRAAGATSRWSGGITGLVVLVLLPFTSLLSPLPTAVLGATIIVAVVEMIRPDRFLVFRNVARAQFVVALVTFLATIALAPHVEMAVVTGVALAILAHLWRELRLTIPTWTSNGTLHIRPRGVLYFASAPGVEEALSGLLAEHPEAGRLVIHLDGLGRVDLTGALALRELLVDAEEAGLRTELADVPPQARKIVLRVLGDVTTIEDRQAGRLTKSPLPNSNCDPGAHH